MNCRERPQSAKPRLRLREDDKPAVKPYSIDFEQSSYNSKCSRPNHHRQPAVEKDELRTDPTLETPKEKKIVLRIPRTSDSNSQECAQFILGNGSPESAPQNDALRQSPKNSTYLNVRALRQRRNSSISRENLLPKTGNARVLQRAPRLDYAPCAEHEEFACMDPGLLHALIEELKGKMATRLNSLVLVYNDSTTLLGDAQRRLLCSMSTPYCSTSADDETLVFNSRFECGNLSTAVRIGLYEYELQVRTDWNTAGHTQWFYFSVQNMRKGPVYIFHIVNFCKTKSLYENGLRPIIFSEQTAKVQNIGWHRCGEDIAYFQNCRRRESKDSKSYFTLSFKHEFTHEKDCVYFAHCYPYSYSQLQEYLSSLEGVDNNKSCLERTSLCRTAAGNVVDLLTITSKPKMPQQRKNRSVQRELKFRPAVVISARVHPGETNSSWIMKGIIDFLLSDQPFAEELRDSFVFKLVPMLNPDGVINGSYRCALSGHDLNRRWLNPCEEMHTSIFHYKQMIENILSERTILLACDLHGHSRQNNSFLYGCDSKFWKEADGPAPKKHQEKVFATIMAKNSDAFCFRSCRFAVRKSKESSGRVVCWRKYNILNSFTLETSFGGADQGKLKGKHFSIGDLEEIGRKLMISILQLHTACSDESSLSHYLLDFGKESDEEEPVESDYESSSEDEALQDPLPKASPAPPKQSTASARPNAPLLKKRESTINVNFYERLAAGEPRLTDFALRRASTMFMMARAADALGTSLGRSATSMADGKDRRVCVESRSGDRTLQRPTTAPLTRGGSGRLLASAVSTGTPVVASDATGESSLARLARPKWVAQRPDSAKRGGAPPFTRSASDGRLCPPTVILAPGNGKSSAGHDFDAAWNLPFQSALLAKDGLYTPRTWSRIEASLEKLRVRGGQVYAIERLR